MDFNAARLEHAKKNKGSKEPFLGDKVARKEFPKLPHAKTMEFSDTVSIESKLIFDRTSDRRGLGSLDTMIGSLREQGAWRRRGRENRGRTRD
jgi:hypothetical protein